MDIASHIVTIAQKADEKFLRGETHDFDFAKYPKREIHDVVRKMREMMRKANGIGLSANQAGLNFRMFVAEVPDKNGNGKFYAVFNPKLEILDKEEVTFEEGCLSVPKAYGEVTRPARVLLTGFDKNGKKLKIKVWGLLARVFQHEMDHLNGKLFIDRTKNVHYIEQENGGNNNSL